MDNHFNQKYQYYLHESQKLTEQLQEERLYIDLLESIVSEILTEEEIAILAEGEKRAKRILAAKAKADKKSVEARRAYVAGGGKITDTGEVDPTDSSPEAVAARAKFARVQQLHKAGVVAVDKLKRRVSKGLQTPGSLHGSEGYDHLPKPGPVTALQALGNMFKSKGEVERKETERRRQKEAHQQGVEQAVKNRLDPNSTTSGSNAPKTAAKALEGGASERDAAALLQKTTKDLHRAPVTNADPTLHDLYDTQGHLRAKPTPRLVTSTERMPQTAAQRIVKQVVNRRK